MPQVLIETRLNSLKLCESAQPRKGCLGRIEGICADFKNPTRNGRYYSRELWENVFKDELVQESLKTCTLIGELDHPEERFETLAQEACVVMTDYKFNDEDQTLTGGFDILDTYKGRTLKALLDYGCVMGVSSRGQGDVNPNGEYEEVDPNTYDFAGFDVVLTPAVKTARQKVVESTNKTIDKIVPLTESINNEIKSTNSIDALNNIAKLIENAKLPNSAELISAISDKCKSLEEGKTISEQVKKDLHDVKIRNRQLEKKIKSNAAETIREQKRLNKTISDMTSKILAYQHREKRLTETLSASRKEIIKLTRKVENVQDTAKTANKALKTESNRQKSNESLIQKLNIKISQLTESNNSKDNEINSLQSKLNACKEKISSLTEQLKTSRNNTKSLTESANRSKQTVLTENQNLKSELQTALFGYASVISTRYGLNESMVKSITKDCKSISEVDTVIKEAVDKQDRYSDLPFTTISNDTKSTLIENVNIKSSEETDEDAQTRRFISTAFGVEE